MRRSSLQAQDLVQGLAVGDQAGLNQFLPSFAHYGFLDREQPGHGSIGVVAQPLSIADGNQQQVQSQGLRTAAFDMTVTDQPVVDPAKVSRNLPDSFRTQQSFDDHRYLLGLPFRVPYPECFARKRASGVKPWRYRLVTQNLLTG